MEHCRQQAMLLLCQSWQIGHAGLEPLELRWLRCDRIQYYKTFNNLTSLNPVEYFTVHKLSLSARALRHKFL